MPPLASLGATALVVALAFAGACSTPSSQPKAEKGFDAGSYDVKGLLDAFGQCALGNAKDVANAAVALKTAVDAADPSNLAPARTAWGTTIDAFEQTEMMHVGPVAPTDSPGGQGLREMIYAWPLVGRCSIDQALAAKSYEQPSFLAGALADVRGLGALEYLLFYEGTDNGCAATASINTSGAWAAIAKEELAARKLAFAKVLAGDVVTQTQAVVDAWEPGKGGFLDTLRTAGPGNALFPSQQAAVNAVSDGIFYLDRKVKDGKLGAPLGLTPDCATGSTCPDLLESKWAHRSTEALRNNFIGFRKIFQGCAADFSGQGFDDLLVAVGAGQVAERMTADAAALSTAIDAVPGPSMHDALASDPASVRRVYDAVKAVTDAMKTEFIGVLSLELPKHVEGDND